MGPCGSMGILEQDDLWRRHPGSCEGESTEVSGKCQPAPHLSAARDNSSILHL